MARTITMTAGALAIALGLSACAGHIGRDMAPGLAEGFNTPRGERALADVIRSEPVREAVADLSMSVIDDSLEGMNTPERAARLDVLTERVVSSVGRAMGGQRGEQNAELERAISRTLSAAIESVIAEMGSARARQVVASLVDAAIVELATAMRDEMGPAAAQAIRDDIAPAVASSARVVTREGARGAEEALVDGPLVTRVLAPVERLGTIGWIFVALFAIAILGGGASVHAALRRQRIESRRHEALAMLIASALVQSDRQFMSRRTLEALVKTVDDEEGAVYLRELLRAAGGAPNERERGREPPTEAPHPAPAE